MTQRQSFVVLAMHSAVAVMLIAAACVLGALGVLSGEAVTGIFGAVLGFVGGAGITQGQAIINGGSKPDLTRLALLAQASSAATEIRREEAAAAHSAAGGTGSSASSTSGGAP